MATTILDNVPRNFAATAQTRYKNAYRRRLMDRTILGDLCNANPENIKQFLGNGKGLKVEMYIPGTVLIRDTQPDGEIIYQQMTDATETFSLPFESYWALKFRPEDMSFMPWDPRSDYFTNAADQMARHQEKKFGALAPLNVPSFNKGHNAGAVYGSFDLGTPTEPVYLYKTQAQCDAATGVEHRDVAADFMVKIANVIRENEGLSGGHINLVFQSPVKHLLQTSELKFEGFMGRNAALGGGERGGRAEVKFLGTMDDTITVIQNNIMFRSEVLGSGVRVYPIFAMMQDAYAFVNDTVFRDSAMKDVGSWDEHSRAKEVYGMPCLFPQMSAIGYVAIPEPAYSAG